MTNLGCVNDFFLHLQHITSAQKLFVSFNKDCEISKSELLRVVFQIMVRAKESKGSSCRAGGCQMKFLVLVWFYSLIIY